MDDSEIQETVEAILGKGVKVVDCEKKSSIKEEEILLINGLPVKLEGRDGMAIKQALLTGQVPPCDLLNKILIKAGILRAPVQLETSLSVKTSTITKEEITVAKGGKVVDERHRETKEDNYYTSATSEIWEPVDILPTSQLPQQCILSNLNSSTSNSDSSIPPKQPRQTNTSSTTNGTSRNNIYRSDTESSCYDKRKYNSVCTSESSTSSYDNDSNDENCSNSPILLKNNHQKNGYLNSVISRDSGHDLSNSVSAMSNTTTTRDPGFCGGNTFTPTSVSSLSSLDETDFVSNLSNRFKNNCDIVKNNGVNTNQQTNILPTIFGTVTSDHTPKDGANRRSLPQTPQSSKNFSALYTSGENGANPNIENMSDTELSADNALVYRDGNLISGPLEALILHMVPTNLYYPDRAYIFAFLLSSRLYIKPHELLARVCTLCCSQQQLPESFLLTPSDQQLNALETPPVAPPPAFAEGHTDAGALQFTTYLIQLLAEWTETFPYDFRDERVMQHVFNITQKCVQLNGTLRSNVSSLLQNLLQRLTTLENYEEFLQKLSSSEQELDPNADITEICPSAATLAQQLTHIELERLSYIGPEEFVQAFAKENPHLETSFKDMKKTRNLESYVQWFNRLSYFVATEVSKYPKKKLRVKVVEYWIETAKECFNIGNFNSLMAIIAGLNMSPISRLKKTWSKIQSGKFSILEHQMDPSSNFSSYRSTLKAAMWRSAGARDERQRIVIPFFSLLVKDLYFLNEGCSNKLPNGHINFEKFWQLAKQVTEFMAWKQVTCPFEKNARVITLLQTSAILSENSLALASFECEQPENNQERERYKSLKAESNNAS